jgi:hypothetical protein
MELAVTKAESADPIAIESSPGTFVNTVAVVKNGLSGAGRTAPETDPFSR